ncbi:glycosyltransferase family protein [Leptolyngbya sp. AN03gr2]|uniref:glycosyltransferase n=1 Tax=unclassified Leptolyngbya TaxID=2650499 RepID=UPI003D31AC1E
MIKELLLHHKPVPLSSFELSQANPSRIIACPNPPIEAVQAGHAIAIESSRFNVRQIVKQLPFEPDLVSLSARLMSFQPRGLSQLNCPTVMKLGDTFHFGDGGLSQMIRYCQQLDCDYHWTYQSPQHLHFFAESGLKNVFWLPVSIVLDFYVPPASEKLYDVVFRGSKSELHWYRNYLLDRLDPCDAQTKDYISCLQDYAKAHIVVNTSLNGDLNRRVFEVLMAGGFLLTDRIRPQTGLFELFEEGVHFECYGNETELHEKIQFYLAHPEQAAQIAATGHQRFLDRYSPKAIQQKLYDYIFNYEIESLFQGDHDRRSQTTFNLQTRIQLYELVQEIHRVYPALNILCDRISPEIVSDLADLSRSHLTYRLEPDQITEVQAAHIQAGIQNQISLQQSLEAESTFQLILIDYAESLQDSIAHLSDLGFLIVLNPRLITLQQLNRQLEQYYCFPIKLSVELFGRSYCLSLEGQGIVYRKIMPEGDSEKKDRVSNLAVKQISSEKVIKQQFKHLSIVRFAIDFLRSIRS